MFSSTSGKVTQQEEQALLALLLSPGASTERPERSQRVAGEGDLAKLTEKEVRTALEAHVPAVAFMMDRTGQRPVADYIWMTYDKGLPLYRQNATVQQHTIRAIRYIFHCALSGKRPGGTDALKRLAEAFQSCQAEQGRTIDVLFGQLSGRDASFKEQVLALVDNFKDLTLEAVVHALNPGAKHASDSNPGLQAPHITSAYLEVVGPELGLRGMAAASSDYNRPRGVKRCQVLAAFHERFSLQELAGALAADVNQASADADRIVDRELLAKWAAEAAAASAGAFDAHSIFFDEERAQHFEGRPAPGDEFQPFLSRRVAMQVLVHLFLRTDDTSTALAEERIEEHGIQNTIGSSMPFLQNLANTFLTLAARLDDLLGLSTPPPQKASKRRRFI
mmetsp:Transcript_98226/g.219287  ORF Transcript_98226/g.219287 Transcript_98226/m.219287 type:complete len:392 (-) Transcript_98226:41-1216(-)